MDENSLSLILKEFLLKSKELIKKLIEDVLGVKLELSKKISNISTELIEFLLEIRWNAKLEKNWELADSIRNKLLELGIEIKDAKERTVWKQIN